MTDRRLITVLLLWLAFILAANYANAQLTPQPPLTPPPTLSPTPGPGLTPAVRYSLAGGEYQAHVLEYSTDGHNWTPLPASSPMPRYWIREKVASLVIRVWEVSQQ